MLITTVCAALTAAGLAVAFLTAYRRRFVTATRVAAFALLPLGLAMAGLVELGGKVGKAVGKWAADLVLDPQVWSGVGVLAVAVVLFVVAHVAGARSTARTGDGGSRKERRAAARAERAQAPAPGGRAPAVGSGGKAGAKPSGGSGGAGAADDFSDIEAILKKHGI
ncbi:hypothetical protein [Streptomyces phytohabitans]|uniref:hypothetical protein n=1 Tax=Streptomyces phytohabitans TaxID=1150371 RepID=UPI00345C5D3C